MTKEKILNELFESKEIQKIIDSFTKDQYYREEIRSELFLILTKKKAKPLIKLYKDKKIASYINGIIARMFNSSTHTFYSRIKKPRRQVINHIDAGSGNDLFDNIEDPENNFDHLADNALREVSKLSEPDKIIFQFLYEGLNIKQIAEKTGINGKYVSEMITRIRTHLKTQIRKDL